MTQPKLQKQQMAKGLTKVGCFGLIGRMLQDFDGTTLIPLQLARQLILWSMLIASPQPAHFVAAKRRSTVVWRCLAILER